MNQRKLYECGFAMYLVGNDDLSEEEFRQVIEAIKGDDLDRLRELSEAFNSTRNW